MQTITVPSVVLAGEDDGVLRPGDYERAQRFHTRGCEIVRMPGGHFLHREHLVRFLAELLRVLKTPEAQRPPLLCDHRYPVMRPLLVVVLAVHREGPEAQTLLRVDARAGTLEPLFAYRDCPGELSLAQSRGARYVIQCRTRPDPSRFVFRRRWNEVIDVARRVRWREPSLVLGLLPDGTPIGSDVPANAWPEPSWFHRAFTIAIE